MSMIFDQLQMASITTGAATSKQPPSMKLRNRLLLSVRTTSHTLPSWPNSHCPDLPSRNEKLQTQVNIRLFLVCYHRCPSLSFISKKNVCFLLPLINYSVLIRMSTPCTRLYDFCYVFAITG